jgi:RHS repeat-associated protein
LLNELASGTYLRYRPLTIVSISNAEEDDEITGSIDIQARKIPSVPIIIDPIDPIDPVDPIDPIDPVDPIDPIDPVDPIDTVLPPPINNCFDCDPQHLYTSALSSLKSTVPSVKNEFLYCTDPNNSSIKYYNIPIQYMDIAQCLAFCSREYSIFEGIPGGIQTAVWKNPTSLAFEPVAGVCGYTELDSVKVRHLKAYEKVKILADSAAGFVERAFYYDSKGRVIQTVEKNHLGYISRYSVKYDFVGNIIAQHESHQTGNNVTDTKYTKFTYDQRGRLLAEATVINASDTAKVEYKYNELGQQTAKIYDNNLVVDSTKYNIQGWVTEKTAKTGTDDIFNMQLAYYNPAQMNTEPSYTGNITEWTWQHENATANTYAFKYDKLSRLTESLMYVNNVAGNAFTEQGLTYDRNGNIKTLKRYDQTNMINDIVCGYSGNRLWTVNNTPAYNYDANGNMNKDYRKNLELEYNLLNLPYKIIKNDTVKAAYTYIADGTKAGVKDSAGKGFDYLGTFVYANENNVRTFESTNFGGGRINKTNNAYDINYFITDHLGSTRVIVDANGTVKGQYNYYPFGKQWEDINLMANTNRYTFSGKEKQTIRDLGWLDFMARMYANSEIPRFTTQDPLSEKYYSLSPYMYCAGNPLRYVDPTGMMIDGYTVDDYGYLEKINNEGGEEYDVIYKKETYKEENKKNYDETGNSDGLKISKGIIQSDKPLSTYNTETGKTTGISNIYEVKTDSEATKIFEFMSKNTNVEWSNTYMKDSKGNEYNFLMTTHQENTITGSYYRLTYLERKLNSIIIRNDHIHPNGDSNPSLRTGDMGNGWELQRLQPNDKILFRIFAKGKYYPYKIPKERP